MLKLAARRGVALAFTAALSASCTSSSTGGGAGVLLDPNTIASCRSACRQAPSSCSSLCSASCAGLCTGTMAPSDFPYVDYVECASASVTFHKGGASETCSP